MTGSAADGAAGESPPDDDGPPDPRLEALLARARVGVSERIHSVAASVDRIARGSAGDEVWQEAEREAHKVVGTAGTVGMPAATALGRELEVLLAARPTDPVVLQRARELTVKLVGTVPASLHEAARADRRGAEDLHPADDLHPLLLVALPDRQRSEALCEAARDRGLRAEVMDPSEPIPRWQRRPFAVLVEFPPELPAGATLPLPVRPDELGPPPVVVALAHRLHTRHRISAVRAGVTEILDADTSAEAVLDVVAGHLEPRRVTAATVLAVDDDPTVLDAMRAVLAETDLALVTLAEPGRFWEALVESAPELLVLDVDMPQVSGLELCRMVRSDARWRLLPVLFLSAYTDAGTLREVFAAGADDFVTKPFIGPELRARILNRLERVHLHRQLAETDPLTGLANRRKLAEQFARMAAFGSRRGEPLALAVLDLDRFKQVNDEHGHDVGDTVLRHLARHLTTRLRREDVVARIGGEEFVVALLGVPGPSGK